MRYIGGETISLQIRGCAQANSSMLKIVCGQRTSTAQTKVMSRTARALRNSIIYGADSIVAFGGAFVLSIFVARILGPDTIGYYSYISFLVASTGRIGTLGIPATVRKYTADYLGEGSPGKAKTVYLLSHRINVRIIAALTLIAFSLVATLSDPKFLASTVLLVAAMPLRMMSFMPSALNEARNDLISNLHAAIANLLTNASAVVISLLLGWGVTGIAAGFCLGYLVECSMKLNAAWTWLSTVSAEPIPDEMKRRLTKFSAYGSLLDLLSLTVFDRSDMIFLRWFHVEDRQLTFFSLSSTINERLLLVPNFLIHGVGVSIVNEHRSHAASGYEHIDSALRYLAVVSAACFLCAAALSPFVPLLYGPKYAPLAGMVAVAAVFAVFKATASPAQILLQAHEKQHLLLRWWLFCAVLNVVLDVTLIPRSGVMGAVIANGVTQSVCALGMWVMCVTVLHVPIQLAKVFLSLLAGTIVAGPVLVLMQCQASLLYACAGLCIGVALGSIAVKAFGLVTPRDLERANAVLRASPSPLRRTIVGFVSWLGRTPHNSATGRA